VVYLHGLGGDGSDVKSINTQLASQVRVCTYDRVNVGRSDRVEGRHSGADSVRDLHAKVPDVPVTYLAARPVELPPNWPVKRMQAFIRIKQLEFTKAVPQGRLVEVQSSHDIDLEQPELVVKEINRILEMA
jgi:pimeloyl-ACP methyl ester carboxylesterase